MKSRPVLFVVGLIVIGAALVVLSRTWSSRASQDLRIRVYAINSAGSMRELGIGDEAKSSDRIQVEVESDIRGTAYWGVFSKEGDVLGDLSTIARSELLLEPGAPKMFKETFFLAGEIYSERVVVVRCDKPQDIAPLIAMMQLRDEVLPQEGCAKLDRIVRD